MTDSYSEAKSMRLLTMYSRLSDGKLLRKSELAQEFGITNRSVQRDLETLRLFLAEEMLGRELVYDSRERGYKLDGTIQKGFSNSEVLAVCKILLESRSMRRDEMMPILDKLLDRCLPEASKKAVTALIANERLHYVEPKHGKSVLDGLWEIGQAVKEHRVMEMEYLKLDGKTILRVIEPVGLMFSEYYFYLVAFVRNEPRMEYFRKNNKLLPTIYRVDRIQNFKVTDEHFTPAYSTRFQEGEFRKRIQFMFGGKLNCVRFKYTGPSIEAVLDRLPTAKILSQDEEGWLVSAEVFGSGIEMWLRSQGSYIRTESGGGDES